MPDMDLTAEELTALVKALLVPLEAMPTCVEDMLDDYGRLLYRRFEGYAEEDETDEEDDAG